MANYKFNMKNIIISPIHDTFFSGRIWMGLDFEKIKKDLESKFGRSVHIISFTNLCQVLSEIPKDSLLFYSSSYNQNYQNYIKDTIRYISLARPDIIMVPNVDQLNALENKGYQELFKNLIGIEQVKGSYYGDIDDLVQTTEEIKYPFVLKKLTGALSSGVSLIANNSDLEETRNKMKKKSLRDNLAYQLNKRNSFRKDSNLSPVKSLLTNNFQNFFAKRIPVVKQEFVKGLECDYKVLIFGDKYFIVQRGVRENDFRASGSGKLKWIQPPVEILNYAKELLEKFKVPFISLDLGIDKDRNTYLFEFQGTAFGPATLTNGDKYFIYDEEWKTVEGAFDLEEHYAYALNYFINENS